MSYTGVGGRHCLLLLLPIRLLLVSIALLANPQEGSPTRLPRVRFFFTYW